jgi:hypothetical protein
MATVTKARGQPVQLSIEFVECGPTVKDEPQVDSAFVASDEDLPRMFFENGPDANEAVPNTPLFDGPQAADSARAGVTV